MKKNILNRWALAAALMMTCQPLLAQSSEVVAIDDAGGSQAFAAGISSLDFYDNGLFWTAFGGSCSGEFTTHPSFAILGFRNRPFPAEHYIALGCQSRAVGGAVRDDAFAFYTTPGGVMRKPIGAGPNDNPRLTGLGWGDLNPGAMMEFNGRAYYSYHSPGGQISGGRGYFAIEYFDLPGAGGFLTPVTEVSHGGGLPNVGRIKKMGVIYRRYSGGGPRDLAPYGLALTEGGYLLLFFVEQTIPAWRGASIIASGVTDFAVRREQFPDPDPFRLPYQEDQLYASIGTSRCPSDPPSRLVIIDPITHATSTVYTAPDGYISAVGADPDYLFVSTFGRRQLGGVFGGCELVGSGVIRSKCSPAFIFGACGGADPNWSAIELSFAGENLRSDGQWLYFTRGKEVRRMRNNSPAARQDIAALGLEAVQVVQDLNNSVRLVEGKRTVVRAYARVVESSSIQTDWFPNAQLRGFRNGVELPGPIFPIGNARIARSGDLSVLRPDANRSFQFELPSEWVRSGRLTLRFTVNPNLATSEYIGGADPLGNNTVVAADIPVVQVRPPCFVFSTIHHDGPNYWPWENADNFARIMDRAKALLPVPDIHIHTTTERVSDEHVCIRTCDGPLGIPYPCGFICNDPFDLSDKDDWDEALEELESYDSFDQNRPGCGRTHYVGAIHPANPNVAWAGLGRTPGNHFLVRMNPADGSVAFNSALGGRTMAHEFAHNLGRQHVNQNKDGGGCGGNTPDRPDMSYPFNGCTFGSNNIALAATPMGFDMVTFSPVAPTAAGDLLSYAGNRWPSVWSYNAMLNALGPIGPASVAADPPAGPYLLVRGILNLARGTVRLKSCYSLSEGVADPSKVQSSLETAAMQGGHGYFIRKLDAAGTLLEEVPLILKELDDANEDTSTINQFITKPAGMAALQVVRAGLLLAECRATPNAPVVNGVTALYDPQGPSLQVSINATDLDRDPLLFSVQFSTDNGATWRTLRVNEGSLSFMVNPRFLPGGAQCRVRAIASDGFNSAVALSDPFALPAHAPEPFIGGVRDGQRLPCGTRESLLGFALDAEDGSLPAARLSWDLAGPTPKTGVGASLPLHGLSPGIYTATLTTTDSHNNPGAATLTFEILALVVAESAAPVVDGEASDAAYANASTVSLPLSPKTKAQFTHAGGNLFAAFTDLFYGGPSLRGRIGLYLDVNASGDATAQPGDLAFYVDEDGVPEQYEGNGTDLTLKASPSSGFKAVITRGPGGWSAEFRIADSLLGGWNHAARLGVFSQSATTIYIFGTPIDVPVFAPWPVAMNLSSPSTWASAWFGSVPPVPGNLPPVAKAEAPRYPDASGPTKVTLNGSASFDPEGAALGYTWTQLEGPSVTLENATTATPAFTANATSPVTFRFQLVVNDGELESAPAQVEVILSPVVAQQVQLPPTAARQQDGSVTVGLAWPGRAGDQVIIQASTDLVTWEDIGVSTVGFLQVVLFTDAQAGIYPHRFYRLSSSPSEPSTTEGTALQFDGVDDFVQVPSAPALDAFPLTAALWVKTSDTGYTARGLVSKYADSAFEGYSLLLSEGRVRAWYFRNNSSYVWDGGLGLDGGFVADGQWHQIALVVDSASGRLYVDGSLRASLAWVGTGGAATSAQPLQLGRYFNYPVTLNGEIDEIALWNRALPEAEINGLMPGRPSSFSAGLIGYWSLDENSGETVADSSGYGHHGTLQNGPTRIISTAPIEANPAAGSAIRFDGVNDSVAVNHNTALNLYPLTVTAWIKTSRNTPDYLGVVNKYVGGSGNGYSLHIHNGRVYAWYFGGPNSYVYNGDPGWGGTLVSDGQWHHLAMVINGSGGRLYVDGIQTASLGWFGAPSACTTTTPLSFGRYPGQASLPGRMDEVTLWNRDLSASEVNSLMLFSPTGAETGLVGYWPFEDGSGVTATDATGHGWNGTLLNGALWVPSDAPLYP